MFDVAYIVSKLQSNWCPPLEYYGYFMLENYNDKGATKFIMHG